MDKGDEELCLCPWNGDDAIGAKEVLGAGTPGYEWMCMSGHTRSQGTGSGLLNGPELIPESPKEQREKHSSLATPGLCTRWDGSTPQS